MQRGKAESKYLFDVTMGSWDGAETCELVGSYILSLIREKHDHNIVLYRDDALGAFNQPPPRKSKLHSGIEAEQVEHYYSLHIFIHLLQRLLFVRFSVLEGFIGESLFTFFASLAYVPLFLLELQNRLF